MKYSYCSFWLLKVNLNIKENLFLSPLSEFITIEIVGRLIIRETTIKKRIIDMIPNMKQKRLSAKTLQGAMKHVVQFDCTKINSSFGCTNRIFAADCTVDMNVND